MSRHPSTPIPRLDPGRVTRAVESVVAIHPALRVVLQLVLQRIPTRRLALTLAGLASEAVDAAALRQAILAQYAGQLPDAQQRAFAELMDGVTRRVA